MDLTQDYGLREYLSEILIKENSPLAGQTLSDSDLGKLDFRVLKVLRKNKSLAPQPGLELQSGDVLVVNGPIESLMKVRETEGIDIRPDVKFSDSVLEAGTMEILELLVTPQSGLRGRRIQNLDLPHRFGVTVLAINRHGRHLREKLKSVRLETGDILLAQGPRENMEALRNSPDFAVFDEQNPVAHRGAQGPPIILALLGVGGVAERDRSPPSFRLFAGGGGGGGADPMRAHCTRSTPMWNGGCSSSSRA